MAVKMGDVVKFHYTGKLENGEVFSSSKEDKPVECKVGEGKLIKGIEEGLVGMNDSETKEITVLPEKGYGQRANDRIVKVDKNILEGREVKQGQAVEVKTNQGNILKAVVVGQEADVVILDFNHPLAGKTLKFDIELLGIN